MFERYTEKARRVIFFARYEASQFGSPQIQAEYILLGLMREDKALLMRFVRPRTTPEAPAPGPHMPTAAAGFGFFELVLKVTSLDASIDFYSKLGFAVFGDCGPGTIILTNGTSFLRLDQNPVADSILSLRNDDIIPTISRLESHGIQFEQPPQTAPDGSTTAMLRNPDGHIISLFSPPRSAPPRRPM
jgi:predicted enzyme related to lactoylglutathione lyase